MIFLIFDMLEALKNSEKNKLSFFHVILLISIIKSSIFKVFNKLERIPLMGLYSGISLVLAILHLTILKLDFLAAWVVQGSVQIIFLDASASQ